MADNKYDNQIALWKRQPRETDKAGVKYPHYTGKATIGGEQKKAAGWINTEKTKDTQPDISIKLSEFENKEEAPY
jgi:hypothetical protein|tara:strand:+ start:2411 stop:2635 length:225 start_codon:yes stop_codon:yes gene_type:complete